MVCWFKTRGESLKSPINSTPFQVELTEQQPSKKRQLTFNLFLCFKSSQKSIYFFTKLSSLVMYRFVLIKKKKKCLCVAGFYQSDASQQ